MKLKDVIHLYLGCECEVQPFGAIKYKAKFVGLLYPAVHVIVHGDLGDTTYNIDRVNFKLLLRPLDSMTEEENNEFKTINRGNWIDMHWYSEGYLWLLSKGFDLFNLIPNGEALNINEYKPLPE